MLRSEKVEDGRKDRFASIVSCDIQSDGSISTSRKSFERGSVVQLHTIHGAGIFTKLYHHDLGMSENGVYPQWNSHLVGIMISKTIGYNGVYNIFRQTHLVLYRLYRWIYQPWMVWERNWLHIWSTWGLEIQRQLERTILTWRWKKSMTLPWIWKTSMIWIIFVFHIHERGHTLESRPGVKCCTHLSTCTTSCWDLQTFANLSRKLYPRLLYACPGEQRTVRVEPGQMFWKAPPRRVTWCAFCFCRPATGAAHLEIQWACYENAGCKREIGWGREPNWSSFHHLGVNWSSCEDPYWQPQHPFPLILGCVHDFSRAQGDHSISKQHEAHQPHATRPTPQVVLSSATSMGEQAMTMFKDMRLLTKRILSSKHWTNWDMFASGSHRWHLHRGCQMRAQVRQLELSVDKPLFARMVSETSVMDLRKVLPGLEDMVVDPLHKQQGYDWSREYRVSLQCLQQEEEGVIENICEEQSLSPFSLRTDLQEWIDLAGKTTVLLAVSQVDAVFSIFKPDLKHVQGKVMRQDPNEAFTEDLRKVNISKLFRGRFFKKEPFHAVWKDLSVDPDNQRRLNLAILLTWGIGVFSQEINELHWSPVKTHRRMARVCLFCVRACTAGALAPADRRCQHCAWRELRHFRRGVGQILCRKAACLDSVSTHGSGR